MGEFYQSYSDIQPTRQKELTKRFQKRPPTYFSHVGFSLTRLWHQRNPSFASSFQNLFSSFMKWVIHILTPSKNKNLDRKICVASEDTNSHGNICPQVFLSALHGVNVEVPSLCKHKIQTERMNMLQNVRIYEPFKHGQSTSCCSHPFLRIIFFNSYNPLC